MKKVFLPSILVLLAFWLAACNEEPFSPKGEYQERYALFGIMRADTNLQVVTVTKSYDVEGLNPFANKKDPFVKNCFIRIWRGKDEVHILRDSVTVRTIDKRYPDSARFYYTDNLIPKKDDVLEIECLLPNGRRLKAKTMVLNPWELDVSHTDNIFPSKDKPYVMIRWRSSVPDLVYSPRVMLYYDKKINGVFHLEKVDVPLTYTVDNGKRVPVYARPSNNLYLKIDTLAIGNVLREISKDDPVKSNYRIRAIIIHFYIYDRNLSAFYSSSRKIGDEFSVRVDELDFTNIEGGFGVFGSYTVQKYAIFIDTEYLLKMGYSYLTRP